METELYRIVARTLQIVMNEMGLLEENLRLPLVPVSKPSREKPAVVNEGAQWFEVEYRGPLVFRFWTDWFFPAAKSWLCGWPTGPIPKFMTRMLIERWSRPMVIALSVSLVRSAMAFRTVDIRNVAVAEDKRNCGIGRGRVID